MKIKTRTGREYTLELRGGDEYFEAVLSAIDGDGVRTDILGIGSNDGITLLQESALDGYPESWLEDPQGNPYAGISVRFDCTSISF